MRRIATGSLALIALYTVLTRSEKFAGLLGTSTGALKRLSSPDVALIPNIGAAKTRDNSSQAVYGQGGGQYIGSTFVPNSSYSVNVPQTAGQ